MTTYDDIRLPTQLRDCTHSTVGANQRLAVNALPSTTGLYETLDHLPIRALFPPNGNNLVRHLSLCNERQSTLVMSQQADDRNHCP